jgi:ATP-binding protein involved in chromosome partitioning
MENVERNIIVLSGKGGVGKSTIAANLAVWLSEQGKSVGLLDIDIHGPSIPKLLNLGAKRIHSEGDKIKPLRYSDTLKVISIGCMLESESDALIWRGPMKHNVIRQFVCDVDWGKLAYLVIDCPPGTGDEALSIVQLITSGAKQNSGPAGAGDGTTGAVIVTTPQELAVSDVKKCITFCRQLKVPVLGVIENMSGFVCPQCGRRTDIFSGGGGQQLSEQFSVPFLGGIGIDASMAAACDSGKPFVCFDGENPTVRALKGAFEALLRPCDGTKTNETDMEDSNTMRIAIPVTDGKLSAHFGHCQQFVIVDADCESKTITSTEMLTPPEHAPGVLPKWLGELHVDLIIAGGMGQRAQRLFEQNNIEVVVGAVDNAPEQLVLQYLTGQLECGQNICDH